MSYVCETVKIKSNDSEQGFVIINKSDFEESKNGEYELYEEQSNEYDKMTVPELKQFLTDNSVAFDEKAKKADLLELIKAEFSK